MFDNRLLTNELARIGCPKLAKLEYLLPGTHPNLQWSVTFRLLGVYRWEIDGTVRCWHNTATPFAWRCVRELAGEWWTNSLRRLPNLEAGSGFPVAKLAPWSLMHSLQIKDFSAEESASRVAHDLQEYVLPFVASIRSEERYLELLLADEKPMQWLFSQPLARFAEAAWLCVKLGAGERPAFAALERERRFMEGQLHDLQLNKYAERVFQAAQRDA